MGEEREPACHLRPPRVCLHLAHPSMYGTTCPYLPFGCQPSRQCVVSMRRTSRPFLMYMHEEVVGFMRYESYGKAIGPPARRCRSVGKMLAKCVSQRPTVVGLRPNALLARLAVAIYSRDAFPSALPRQDSAAVRSRASIRGKFCAPCIPKAASGGKIASSRQDSRTMHPK